MIELSSCEGLVALLLDGLLVRDWVVAVVLGRLGFCCAASICVKERMTIHSHFKESERLSGWLMVEAFWFCFIKTGSR